jgi:hypothetical protein
MAIAIPAAARVLTNTVCVDPKEANVIVAHVVEDAVEHAPTDRREAAVSIVPVLDVVSPRFLVFVI